MTRGTEELTQHYSRQFNEELEAIRTRLLEMGGLVERQLKRSLRALVKGNSELGEQVVHDDYQVNRLEVSIDEECSRVIALRQPTASDLRFVMAVIKSITDLERIGDEAEKIGFLSSRLATQERPENRYKEIKHLGRQVREMLRDTLDALARLDAEAALRIAQEDSNVDDEYEAIMRQSITVMMEDPRSIRRVLDTLWAARALERIGDHAVNICEHVVYMAHGMDIRHVSVEQVAAEAGVDL
ncbi:MAG: phosphate signaling complex protein PhoU [Gammaproteobacteria bacterium]|nr:MAG: phosphate signaling complex protein PhoU [Gammaproteobacteria bacterium]